MEKQFQLVQNGQEIMTGDINVMGESGALADDRILAELLRVAPYDGSNVSKLILPYGEDADTNDTVYTTLSADAKVYVRPFRAIVGSRTAASTDARKTWRDIRSGICVAGKDITASTPPLSLDAVQVIAANASGHARWDVLYAIVQPDGTAQTASRAIKASTSGSVTTPSVVTQLACLVSIGYAQGTAASSPVFPSLPADGGGAYNIPIAYILVPDGTTSSSIIRSWQICPATPAPISLSKGLGGMSAAPANESNRPGGTVVQSTSEASWATSSTYSTSARPSTFTPPSMVGCEMLFGTFDFTFSPGSHASLSNVDTSRDWRNRYFLVFWQATTGHIVSDRQTSVTGITPSATPDNTLSHAIATYSYFGFGQSFLDDSAKLPGSPPSGVSIVSWVGHTQLAYIDVATTLASLALYVDLSDGKLKVYRDGTTQACALTFWLWATRPFGSY